MIRNGRNGKLNREKKLKNLLGYINSENLTYFKILSELDEQKYEKKSLFGKHILFALVCYYVRRIGIRGQGAIPPNMNSCIKNVQFI